MRKPIRPLVVLFLLAGCFLAACVNHRDPRKTVSKFFVVRHAERYPGFEGHLTWYGRLRAGELMRRLKDSGVTRIYVTPFSRTLETADSLRLLQKIDTVRYLADSSGADLMRCLAAHKDFGRTVLIVGHSYALPAILRQLGVSDPPPVEDIVYDRLYLVINDHGHATLHPMRYGPANRPDTASVMVP